MFLNLICTVEWGSVPDWVQAIGAVVASIGLVYTLILQQKTLKEQQKITLIEQENFLGSHLPVLEISDVQYTKEDQDRNVKFKITIRTNSLQNLKVTHNFPDNYKITIPHYVSMLFFLPVMSFSSKLLSPLNLFL
ncbi:hypothetical protein [Pedobacter panaciterrae]|uniref:hypothetical protein n=1 Tax=Pedobacter panaciterrae TaxID=363849 RepID=UPI0025916B10|nr:hypothetical protein [uncultured Pedobacter sp.]